MPLSAIGTAAIELLVSMIDNREISNRHVVLNTDLILRGSTRTV